MNRKMQRQPKLRRKRSGNRIGRWVPGGGGGGGGGGVERGGEGDTDVSVRTMGVTNYLLGEGVLCCV